MTIYINEDYQVHDGNYTHGGNSCDYIVVHNTGNTADAISEARYAQNDQHPSSYHYVLDDDDIFHVLNDYDTAWAVGAWRGARQLIGNNESVSIEVCSNGVGFTNAEIENLHFLVRYLMDIHNVPANNVVRHYDCHTGHKDCPAAYVNEDNWRWLHSVITSPFEESAPVDTPHQEAGNPVNDSGLNYRAHVQNIGWCDPVRDGMIAGTVGYGLRLEALQITPPEGLKIGMALHIQNQGWKDFGDVSGKNVGTIGKGLRIEAIAPYVISNTTGKVLYMNIHVQNVGWEGPQAIGSKPFGFGSTGEGKRIEALSLYLL